MPDYAHILDLTETLRRDAPALEAAAEFRALYRSGGIAELKSSRRPGAANLLARYGEARVHQLFKTIDELYDMLWHLNPRRVLSLGHGPGPSLSEEADLALRLLEVFVPGIPEGLRRILESQFMFDNR